ncbi:MAG TPA: hypothetical protein VFQ38_01720 [Longimicrobiales bacterium]|nr:hypothetical protein [Longimicrobiales bacterium]
MGIAFWRWIAAALWIVVTVPLLAWWVKGDLEMAWLVGMPAIVGGATLLGLATGLLLRRLVPTLAAAAAATVLGVLCTYVAINSRHSWEYPPSPFHRTAARRFAADRARLAREAERVARVPVQLAEVRLVETPGWERKRGFSFAFDKRPARIVLEVGFDAGPPSSMEMEVVWRGGEWRLEPRPLPPLPAGIRFRPAPFQRRLPDYSGIEVGADGTIPLGTAVLVRAARAEDDFALAVFRVGPDVPLRELRRYPREEIVRRFTEALARSGVPAPRRVTMYYAPSPAYPLVWGRRPEFDFFGLLTDPRWRVADLQARLDGDTVAFVVRRLRPHPGPGPVGDRR